MIFFEKTLYDTDFFSIIQVMFKLVLAKIGATVKILKLTPLLIRS